MNASRVPHPSFFEGWDSQSSPAWDFSLTPLLVLHHLEIVSDGENSRHAVSSNIRDVLVALIVHHAFERDFSTFDDDANRLLHSQCIFLQRRIAVDCAVKLPAKAVVHRGPGQHFSL